MTMDPMTLLVLIVIGVAVHFVLLYFVIKNAVKNAFIEDRAFQAKVARMRAARTKS